MRDPEILNGLAVFSAGYLKRWLEGNLYDKIFKTELGEKIKSLDRKARYGIEFGLNLLTAFFDQKLAEDSVLKRFIKEVGIDAGPEISKRLVNNAKNPEEKKLVSVLLELGNPTLTDLLNWLYDMDASERRRAIKKMSQAPVDEIIKLAKLTPENRRRLFDLLKSSSSPERFTDKVASRLKTAGEQWENGLDSWENWLSEKRKTRGR